MKIEELHKIIKLKHKKCVSEIEEVPCYLGFGPAYKEFFLMKKDLDIIDYTSKETSIMIRRIYDWRNT